MQDQTVLNRILYSFFMPDYSIVKTITPRCLGRPDASGTLGLDLRLQALTI